MKTYLDLTKRRSFNRAGMALLLILVALAVAAPAMARTNRDVLEQKATAVPAPTLGGPDDNAQTGGAFDAGVASLAQGNYEQAVLDFTDAPEADPESADALHLRAQAYYHLGDYGRANDDMEAAFTLVGIIDASPAYYFTRSAILTALGDENFALQSCSNGVINQASDDVVELPAGGGVVESTLLEPGHVVQVEFPVAQEGSRLTVRAEPMGDTPLNLAVMVNVDVGFVLGVACVAHPFEAEPIVIEETLTSAGDYIINLVGTGADDIGDVRLTVSVEEPTFDAPFVFETDFDTLPDELFFTEGMTTELVEEGGVTLLNASAGEFAVIGLTADRTLTDYAIETRARQQSGTVVLLIRNGAGCEGYYFDLIYDQDAVVIERLDESCASTTIAAEEGVLTGITGWADLRFEARGDQLTGYVNGQEVITVTDATYPEGNARVILLPPEPGLRAEYDFDTLRVAELAAESDIIDNGEVVTSGGTAEAQAAFDLGVEAFDAGDYETALQHFEAAVQADPTYADGYYGRGRAHYALGNMQDALDDLTTHIGMVPDNAEAYYYRGYAHFQLGELDAVVDDCESALRLWETGQVNLQFFEASGSLPAMIGTPGETLHVALPGTAGSSITDRAEVTDGSPLDPLTLLVGPNGDALACSDDGTDGTLNSEIAGFVLPADGTYTIVVGDLFADHTGTLRVTAQASES